MSETDTTTNGEVDLEAMKSVGPEDFAKLMASVTDEQLAEMMSGPMRKQVLDEIFNRMAEHVDQPQGRRHQRDDPLQDPRPPRGPGRRLRPLRGRVRQRRREALRDARATRPT